VRNVERQCQQTNQPTIIHSLTVQTNGMFRNACGTTTAMQRRNMNKCWPAIACIAHAHQTHSCGHPALAPTARAIPQSGTSHRCVCPGAHQAWLRRACASSGAGATRADVGTPHVHSARCLSWMSSRSSSSTPSRAATEGRWAVVVGSVGVHTSASLRLAHQHPQYMRSFVGGWVGVWVGRCMAVYSITVGWLGEFACEGQGWWARRSCVGKLSASLRTRSLWVGGWVGGWVHACVWLFIHCGLVR
jgi:hypothetical protein